MIPAKTILKYRRETDSWICPWCDMENNLMLGKCTLCNYPRTADSSIVRHWTEADDMPRVAPPSRVAPRSSSSFPTLSNPLERPISEDYGGKTSMGGDFPIGMIIFFSILGTILFIILLVVLLAI